MRRTSKTCVVLAVALMLILLTAAAADAFTNLALTATASAFSEQPGYTANLANDGDMNTRWSEAPGSDGSQWYFQYEWTTPQTIYGFVDYEMNMGWVPYYNAQYWDGSAWQSLGDYTGFWATPVIWPFDSPITTTKLRINGACTSFEIQVSGDPMLTGVKGRVYRDDNYNGIPGVTVTCQGQSVTTASDGSYQLVGLSPGSATVTMSKGYLKQQLQDVTITDAVMTSADFPVTDPNIAPLGYPASSSVESSATGAPLAIDEDETNRMVFDWFTPDPLRQFWIFWDSPQTFNQLVLRQWDTCCQTTNLKIEVWDPTLNGGVGDWNEIMAATDLPTVSTINIPTQTTQGLRISDPGLTVIMELEVFNTVSISGTVRNSAGTPVWNAKVTGGTSPVTTDKDGNYTLSAFQGDVTLTASRFPYNDGSISVSVPAEGLTGQDITLSGGATNLALTAAASASGADDGYPVANVNDGKGDTRWQSYPSPAGSERLDWVVYEWPNPETVDTVYVPTAFAFRVEVYAWRNDAWQKVGGIGTGDELGAPQTPLTMQFTPVRTNKIKIADCYSAEEMEVYNVKGSAPVDNLSGTISNSFTKKGLANAVVKVGSTTAWSDVNGNYEMSVPAGSAAVSVSRPPYTPDPATQTVTAPASGVNFGLVSYNIAPYATASASSAYGGNPVSWSNDNDVSTRFSVNPGDSTQEYFLEWPCPVTLNEVKVHVWNTGLMSAAMEVYTWDGSSWVLQGTCAPADLMDLTFSAPVTTTKIRLHNTVSFYECEAFGTINAGSVGAARGMLGAQVSFTGSTTAVFSDAGYVEDLDRACGLRVEPATGFGAQDTSAIVAGMLGMDGLEQTVFASSVTTGDASAVAAVGMPNKSLSTVDADLSTVGMLLTTWGTVVQTAPADGGAKYLYVDDGSLVPSDISGVYALKVGPVVTTYDVGDHVGVTGIGRLMDAGGVPIRVLQPRASSDVVKY